MGYTNVYSLQGGLEAWREVYGDVLIEEYKTVGHNISVSFDASGPIIEITPIEFNYTAGGDCGCGCNQSSPNEVPTNVNSTVLEEDENHRVILIIYEINGTVYETVIETTILWSFEEVTDKENRTGSFVHVVTSTEGNVNEHYELSYDVNSTDYELRISTLLIPLDNGVGYNSSSTVMSYRPVNESEVTSIDSVAINGTVTLSELYSVLGKVSAELSELYAEEGYGGLATSYEAMGMEARFVSGLIETELKRYDWGILSNKATLNDPGFWTCLRGSLFCGGGVGVVIGCAVGTMGTGLVACLAAVFGVSSLGIMAAIASGTGVIWGCIVTCCCSGYDPCCDLL
jgi:hypothetical protein